MLFFQCKIYRLITSCSIFHVAKLLRQIIETKLISLYNIYEELCSNARKTFLRQIANLVLTRYLSILWQNKEDNSKLQIKNPLKAA